MERLDEARRRHILKEDQAWVGKPIGLIGDSSRAVHANTRHMALTLLNSQTPDRASRIAAFAETLIDTTIAAHITDPLACAKGCSHCCTTYVSTTLPEVFRLAQAVRGKSFTEARVVAAAGKSTAMPQ